MVRYHHRLKGHESEQILEIVEDKEEQKYFHLICTRYGKSSHHDSAKMIQASFSKMLLINTKSIIIV